VAAGLDLKHETAGQGGVHVFHAHAVLADVEDAAGDGEGLRAADEEADCAGGFEAGFGAAIVANGEGALDLR
jgi:hypothetical protein